MTNLYLPKEDGSTTEIDLIMLSETGILVFESKNYSGWIFGDEKRIKTGPRHFKTDRKIDSLIPYGKIKGISKL